MKSLTELYDEIMKSDELKAEFVEASKSQESIKAFLVKYECTAEWDEFVDFFKDLSEKDLSAQELAAAAGGKVNWGGITASIVTFGFYCAVSGSFSAISDALTKEDCMNVF